MSQQEKRTIDISGLQDFKISTSKDWTNWTLDSQEFDNIPLGYTNKFNFYKNLKYCDVSNITSNSEYDDFNTVEENVRRKDKEFISKNNRMYENRQMGNPFKRVFNKKMQKNQRHWANYQFKTNFKKITVKNNWKEIKTINKNTLEGLPEVKGLKVQNIKTFGKLRYVDPAVDKISWTQVKFKEQSVYTVDPLITAEDPYLTEIAGKLIEQGNTDRKNIICHPTFLLALLTTKASVYPWNIEVEKDGNIIVLQNFKSAENETEKLTYLDLFNTNENTTNNMPSEEAKLKEVCVTATKMTKVFKDLLASGEEVQKELLEKHFPSTEEQEQEEQEQKQEGQDEQEQEDVDLNNLQKIRKYLKISFQNIDIYTFVEIDGAKRNSTTGELQYFLIRTFMQSETQGAWVNAMKAPGSMMTKEYHSNSCSIQKWICEARLAGVQQIKTGFIAFDQNKTPTLLNVDQKSVKSFENTFSFKYENCWSTVKYILNLLVGIEDGNYVISKDPYTPLSIKLFQTLNADDGGDDEEEQEQANRKNTEQSVK